MQIFPSLILHQAKSKAVKRFHPWIFSGAIKWVDKNVKEGDVVEVLDEKNNFLALGHYAKGSIAVRIFSFENENDLNEFLKFEGPQKILYQLEKEIRNSE